MAQSGATKSRGAEAERANHALEEFARLVTDWTGGSLAFAVAAGTIVAWAASGPFFHYSDTWQLVINTGTTIVTFLMVFLIQRSQNKDARAVHLKLNEIVAALQGASNRLINVEDLTEAEVRALHQRYERLVEAAAREPAPGRGHEGGDGRPRRRIRPFLRAHRGLTNGGARRPARNLGCPRRVGLTA